MMIEIIGKPRKINEVPVRFKLEPNRVKTLTNRFESGTQTTPEQTKSKFQDSCDNTIKFTSETGMSQDFFHEPAIRVFVNQEEPEGLFRGYLGLSAVQERPEEVKMTIVAPSPQVLASRTSQKTVMSKGIGTTLSDPHFMTNSNSELSVMQPTRKSRPTLASNEEVLNSSPLR